jgi:hypothetical protein
MQVGHRGWLNLDHDVLLAHQLEARSPVDPTTPIATDQRKRTDNRWLQEHAHLARLRRSAPIPLTLVAQRTGTTTADAGCMHDAQVPVSVSPLLTRGTLLVGGATQRPIWLEGKVLAQEVGSLPGQAHARGA